MAAGDKQALPSLDVWTSALLSKSTAGRGSNGKQEAYGIKKLRELILELAVRGKLVAQDPSDGPANELLEKITKEKVRLIKDGVIKNEKSLPSVSNEEIPFDVPVGWVWQRLGELGYTQTGGTPSKFDKEHFGNDIPFIKPGDIYPGYVDYDNEGLSNEGANTLGRTAPAGSILMVCIGTIGKCNRIERTCAFNQQINSITPYLEMSGYLLNALSSAYFQQTAWEKSSSTTIAILNKGKWVDIVVPIPPLEEQHRIVAKVDELMALCDQLEQQQTDSLAAHQILVETLLGTLTQPAVRAELVEARPSTGSGRTDFEEAWARIASHFDTLFTTEASIDQLKQTILQLAVMGKLVPQDPNDEPASVLIMEISKERQRLIRDGNAKNKKELAEIEDEDIPLQLPNGWEWVRFEQLINPERPLSYGVLVPGPDVDGGVPFVRIEDLDINNPPEKPAKAISKEIDGQYERTRLFGGEILMGVVGSIGKLGVAPKSWADANIARAICRIFPTESINKHFLLWLLRSEFMQGRFVGDTRTLAQPTLNIGLIRAALTPLPPLAEQYRIVAKLDELMALCDTLKARIKDAQTTQLHLADAIVEQAVC